METTENYSRSASRPFGLIWVLLVVALVGLLSSCASSGYSPSAAMAPSVSAGYYEEDQLKALEESPSGRALQSDDTPSALAQATGQTAPNQTPTQPVARLKIYTGYLSLEVDDVTKRKAEVLDWVTKLGGYVEATYGNRMELRVPANSFNDAMTWLAALGLVKNRSISSTDVTDAFADLEARQIFLQRTLDKLNALLAKATTTKDQLEILQEIRRVTDELDDIKLALQTMTTAIRLSRISVELTPRLQQQEGRTANPFGWIARLTPAYPSLGELIGTVDMQLSANWAVFSRSSRYSAESADQVQVRIASTANDPQGDASFWQKALQFHLQSQYKSAEMIDLGSFKAIVFTSKDVTAFTWLVAIQVKGDNIIVAEALFPNPEATSARLEEVKRALEAAVIR